MEHQPPSFFLRGISPNVKFTALGLVSLAILLIDGHYRLLDVVREKVSVVIYPLQVVATAPVAAAQWVGDFLTVQSELQRENAHLHSQLLQNSAQLLRMQYLQAENQQLRTLLNTTQSLSGHTQFAEILYAGRDPFTRKVIVNRGEADDVHLGEVAIDDVGVLGQVTRVHRLVSEITLITDKNQPVPVQVQRNGARAIVFGTGQSGQMEIRFLPVSADVQQGDVLVTSGIDGTYPAGLPVATVTKIDRTGAQMFAKIVCTPIGNVDKHRYLLILREKQEIPPAPPPEVKVEPKAGKKRRKGNE